MPLSSNLTSHFISLSSYSSTKSVDYTPRFLCHHMNFIKLFLAEIPSIQCYIELCPNFCTRSFGNNQKLMKFSSTCPIKSPSARGCFGLLDGGSFLSSLDIPCWLLDIEYTPFEKGLTCKTASSGANRQAMRMPWPFVATKVKKIWKPASENRFE